MRRKTVLLVFLVVTLGILGCSPKAQEGGSPTSTPTTAAPRSDVKVEGKILLSRDHNVWVLSGGSTKQLTKDGGNRHPAWSPDGKKIAYVQVQEDYSDILTMNSSGGDVANLTRFGRAGADTWAFAPRWSPDGTQLAYLSDQSTYDMALWLMKPDGSSKKQITLMNDYLGGIDGPTWHPKGDSITFAAYRTGKSQIWTMTLADRRWQQITNLEGDAYDPSWATSGEALAFVARTSGKSDIWVTAVPDGTPQQVTRDGLSRAPVWSPDGKVLAFLSGQGGKFDLWAVNVERPPDGTFRFSSPKRVTQGLGADPAGGLSWSK